MWFNKLKHWFQHKEKMGNTIQLKLENAAKGLLMMSESDYPFTYFSTTNKTVDENLILSLTGKPAGTLIEKTDLDYLLRNMTTTASGSVDQHTADRFFILSDQLKKELKGIAVYRVGEVEIEVLIIGENSEGVIAGMRTKLIET